MALVLGVSPGDVIDIARDWIAVLRVDKVDKATLLQSDGSRVAIYADRLTEILPSVYVKLGPDDATARLRLCFDALPDIAITRRR